MMKIVLLMLRIHTIKLVYFNHFSLIYLFLKNKDN